MKKFVILVALLSATCFVQAENNDANKKWLGAVQKMVNEGKTEISTPSQERVDLVKEWAHKEGYSVSVTKKNSGFQVELAKQLAKK